MSAPDSLYEIAWRLGPERYPFLTMCHNPRHGWQPVIAWDPYDIIEETDTNAVDFFSRNHGAMIAGFIGYDTGMRMHGVTPAVANLTSIPGIWFGAYSSWARVTDGQLVVHGDLPGKTDREIHPQAPLELQPVTGRAEYDRSIARIREHIIEGNIYQANLTHFLSGTWNGDPWNLFNILMKNNPVDFAACFLHPEFRVYSLSPERFISVRESQIITEPIKGTRPRGRTEKEDALERSNLLESGKEAAELNMITDLLRNDLGKICKTGSVEVLKHRETMALASVWHTYSVIRGTLPPRFTPIEAVLSMLPGGSITGCPKRRAIKIISELEPHNRNLYTGTIGIQYPDGNSDWNIAIRTLLQEKDRLLLGVGGGITVDSNAEDEYLETLAKAKSFMGIKA